MSPTAFSHYILLPRLHIIHYWMVSPVRLASVAEHVSSSPRMYLPPISAAGSPWTPVLSLQPGPGAELCRSWIMSWWWSVSLWESLLCSYFSAALLPLNTCAAMCSRLWKAPPCRSGWWTALYEDSWETSLPVSSTAAQAEDGFYFSEHIRSSSTAWCSAYCQLLWAPCQGGVRCKLKLCSNFCTISLVANVVI